MDKHDGKLEELDLAIPNMDTPDEEQRAAAILRKLAGVHDVRLMGRGAFVRYRAEMITHGAIIDALRHAGFRASTFQDSKTGKTGKSSQ